MKDLSKYVINGKKKLSKDISKELWQTASHEKDLFIGNSLLQWTKLKFTNFLHMVWSSYLLWTRNKKVKAAFSSLDLGKGNCAVHVK